MTNENKEHEPNDYDGITDADLAALQPQLRERVLARRANPDQDHGTPGPAHVMPRSARATIAAWLRYYDQADYADIAKRLGVPSKLAARTLVSEGLTALKA